MAPKSETIPPQYLVELTWGEKLLISLKVFLENFTAIAGMALIISLVELFLFKQFGAYANEELAQVILDYYQGYIMIHAETGSPEWVVYFLIIFWSYCAPVAFYMLALNLLEGKDAGVFTTMKHLFTARSGWVLIYILIWVGLGFLYRAGIVNLGMLISTSVMIGWVTYSIFSIFYATGACYVSDCLNHGKKVTIGSAFRVSISLLFKNLWLFLLPCLLILLCSVAAPYIIKIVSPFNPDVVSYERPTLGVLITALLMLGQYYVAVLLALAFKQAQARLQVATFRILH